MRLRSAGNRRSLQHPVLAISVAIASAAVVAGAAAVLVNQRPAVSADVRTPQVVAPLTMTAVSPAPSASGVAPSSSLSLTFSAPLRAGGPQPTLSPAVPGSWSQPSADTLTFTPAASLPPGQAVTITVPGGPQGVVGTDGAVLGAPVTTSFTVAPIDTLRLQQLLAQLGYLPLTFVPQSTAPVPAVDEAIDQSGSFSWKWSTFPAALTSQWVAGQYGVMTKGAVMAFEQANGLTVDGIAGPEVWSALLADVASGKTDPNPDYDWVDVSMALPETVTVWRDGQAVYQTPANTGVPAAATTIGTFPVYLRYRTTTMSGTNPNGTHYHDTGIPWVSYFNGGQALHGFVRAAYGFPQSDGCVEMPPANAAVVWPMTPLGTLVTVQA